MSRRTSSSRFANVVAALAAVVFGAGGCDTIHARSIAQDGVALYKDGKPGEAAEKFEEAQKLDAAIPTVWLNLGFAELAVSQAGPHTPEGTAAATRAIAAFEQYLTLKPGEERVVSYLVQTFVDTGRYEDAEKFFRPSVEKSPPDTQALATLGTIASKIGRFDDAAKWYEHRIAAEPESGDARLALSVLLWDRLRSHADIAGKDRVELSNRALGSLKEARRLQPNSPNPFLYTNLVYRERANAGLGDDPKRADLELANAYFRIANGMGKGDKGLEKDKKFVDENSDKADAIVKAAVEAPPPPGAPTTPGAPTVPKAPAAPGSKKDGGK